MSEAKHTPGPWKIDDDQVDTLDIVACYGAEPCICHVNQCVPHYGACGCGTTDPMDNARLIAAAPDLLAACEATLSWFENSPELVPDGRYMIEEAIAKARGGDT